VKAYDGELRELAVLAGLLLIFSGTAIQIGALVEHWGGTERAPSEGLPTWLHAAFALVATLVALAMTVLLLV
jgi:hypothetical protein